jgi:hypothetical protein
MLLLVLEVNIQGTAKLRDSNDPFMKLSVEASRIIYYKKIKQR